MRMRKKKHGAERIAACGELLTENTGRPLDVGAIFGNGNPVHLEIGCGKGNFVCGMAEKFPEINFIAVEKISDVCCIALEKAKSRAEYRKNDNIRFFIGDARLLEELCPADSFDCVYLNFSDPWHKKAHAKRRLTYRSFLDIYSKILKDGGILKLKTDNVPLFDFSLEEFSEYGLKTLFLTRDLHSSEKAGENVMTEYEKNFSEQGVKINSVWVSFPSEKK